MDDETELQVKPIEANPRRRKQAAISKRAQREPKATPQKVAKVGSKVSSSRSLQSSSKVSDLDAVEIQKVMLACTGPPIPRAELTGT